MNPVEELLLKIDKNDLWQEDIELKRNEYLNVKGQINTDLYYVKSGSLRIYVLDEVEEHTIRFGYKNSIFVTLDSFISNAPSSYYIQALKKTELKVVSKQAYMDLVHASIENRALWESIMEQLILQQMERELDLLTSSPQERYNRVLERSPQLFQEIPHKYIASYLRMTPETLSRIKKS